MPKDGGTEFSEHKELTTSDILLEILARVPAENLELGEPFKFRIIDLLRSLQIQRGEIKNPKLQTINPAQFQPQEKIKQFTPEIPNISKDNLVQAVHSVIKNIETWGILTPSVVVGIREQLPDENILPTGNKNITNYSSPLFAEGETVIGNKDSLYGRRDPQGEEYLNSLLNKHRLSISKEDIHSLALELDLAHELGHGLHAHLLRMSIHHNQNIDQPLMELAQVSPLPSETQRIVDQLSSNAKLVNLAQDERISQGVMFAYLESWLRAKETLQEQIAQITNEMIQDTNMTYANRSKNLIQINNFAQQNSLTLIDVFSKIEQFMLNLLNEYGLEASKTTGDLVPSRLIADIGYSNPLTREQLSSWIKQQLEKSETKSYV